MARQRIDKHQEHQPQGGLEGLSPPAAPLEKRLTPDPKGFKAKESVVAYTCEGQISYPLLFTRPEGKKFQATLYIPQDKGNVDDIVKAVNAVGKESFPDHWQNIESLKYPPIKDGKHLKDPREGFWVIAPKSDERPTVWYKNGTTQLTDASQVYGGCWGELALTAKSYCFPDKTTGEINWGVTLVLKDVMKTRDGERLGKSGFRPAAGDAAEKDSSDIPF